jgi:hypothetical protein
MQFKVSSIVCEIFDRSALKMLAASVGSIFDDLQYVLYKPATSIKLQQPDHPICSVSSLPYPSHYTKLFTISMNQSSWSFGLLWHPLHPLHSFRTKESSVTNKAG